MTDRILRTKQIAAVMGLGSDTVRRLFAAGKLRGAWKVAPSAPVQIYERDLRKLMRDLRRNGGLA